MSNVLLGFPIFSDSSTLYVPTFSGGTWAAALPLTNLQDRRLAKVARTSAVTVAATQFDTDLKAARPVRVLSLVSHNFTTAATVRHRGLSALPIFDSVTVGDASWTASGTPTRSAAAVTSGDGVPLDLIGDDTAGANEYFYKAVTFTGNGQKVVSIRMKKGTSAPASGSMFQMFDLSLGLRIKATVTWDGSNAPVVVMTTGTLVSSTDMGSGAYRLVFLSTSVTAANSHEVYVHPAATDAEQGNVYAGDVTAWNAATDQLVYDTGCEAGWPSGVDAEEADGYAMTATHVADTAQSAQYWRTNIADTANADGYVEIGRLVMAGGYQPTYNMSYGARLGWQDPSTRSDSDGSATFFKVRSRRRVASLVLENVEEDEAFDQSFEIQRRLGTTGQLFIVLDPEDTGLRLMQRSFLCVLRELTALEYANTTRFSVPYAFIEEL
jgi:hypothetical protein